MSQYKDPPKSDLYSLEEALDFGGIDFHDLGQKLTRPDLRIKLCL